MKYRLLYIILPAFILLSNRGGYNQGASGAPGDNNASCGQCHGGGNFNVKGDLILQDSLGQAVTEYMPETAYKIIVKGNVTSGTTPKNYGFQTVPLDTTTLKMAGSFSGLGTDVRTLPKNNRVYLLQSTSRADGTFAAKWTSPAKGTGAVKFYMAVLATNGNNNDNGDKVANATFTFAESLTSGITEEDDQQPSIFPNPTRGNFISKYALTSIYNNTGQSMKFFQDGEQIDISGFANGLYFGFTKEGKKVRIIKI